MLTAARRLFGHRWAVVLAFPPVGASKVIVRSPLVRDLRYGEAVWRIRTVARWATVDRAVRLEGAKLEVRRLDRLGFPVV